MDLSRLVVLATAAAALVGLTHSQAHDYKLTLQDVEIETLHQEFIDERSTLEVTTEDDKPVVNGLMVFKQDLPAEATISWELYAKDQNNDLTLKTSGADTQICRFVVERRSMADMLFKQSDVPPNCPYVKREYHIIDAVVDQYVFPVRIPRDTKEYQFRFSIKNDSTLILRAWVDAHVEFI